VLMPRVLNVSSPKYQQPNGMLMAYCPTTGQPIETGIENNKPGLAKTWTSTLTLRCPHCRSVHEVRVRDIFVSGEMASPRLRGNSIL
jgi:hypothetical protein